ncbi:DNA polymerase III, subunit gamma and tau [Candidatus Phytoplasma oryzae]|uniref:DNA polymerase III subunit gamma/tau n=1 Tax=Candidatus Phytoplasma oryzae TaxID=203274 RepID=A0A139JR17_9MOLU|nr:DNA polymerase III subunit gamma/tau [Candidatus Phytoplasma oryzae]KXT29284.1 DNA polymerase III, subunit gamma and tau [Candidatus Phytoplasma oryzae]RAM57680.1 hypothetical protein DH96_02185 [Candidatus Phytoplasma oryzae]
MSYIALYRKYRPQNFYDMMGQYVVIQTLKNAIKYKKIHHCYLLSGNKGIGKTTLANIFVKNINCLTPKNEDCCNNCVACVSINQKNSLDIIEIDGASYNGVDEIRELHNKACYKPNLLKYKVYIIDEVHVLSNNAFNALLKLLEDPPSNIIFILITSELRKIPKTIISRTQHFHLKNISIEHIQTKIRDIVDKEKILIDKDAVNMIAFYAHGSLRDALNLLDQTNSFKNNIKIKRKDIEEILGVVSNDKIEILSQYFLEKEANDIIIFLEEILCFNNINFDIFINDLIDFFQKKMIDHFKNNNNPKNLLYYLSISQKEKFFDILFQLKKNLINSKQKKNLIIINFLKLHQLFKENNFFTKKKITNKPKNEITIINENIVNLNNKQEKKTKFDSSSAIKKTNDFEKKEDNFIKCLKKIFIYNDEKSKEMILKGWTKLKKFPNKNLAIAANFLYKTNLLMISYNKEFLLSCDNADNYKQLLTSHMRNKIKLILNSKKELIKDYFIVLKKDWEEILYPIYNKFKKTNNIQELDFSNFNTTFYEQNSVLNIELNQSIIVKLARDFFGFDKVEIIN